MKRRSSSVDGAPTPRRQCAAMAVHFQLLESDPAFRQQQANLETVAQRRMALESLGPLDLYTIPVVVHVLYHTAADNISDAQIKSQIKVMNRDYRAKNTDKGKMPPVWTGMVSDVRVEFKLATKDPQGKTTTGITRTQTSVAAFEADDKMKFAASGGVNIWPRDKYLNIWVCTLGGGLLGYAQFPGGPAKTDGVVILNTAFGTSGTAKAPFNLGRTTTHEVGHWLNLRHIWGDTEDCTGSDFVSDTPNAAGPNFGKPAWPHVSCHNGPNGDMFMNYMDYVDDDAMIMFSPQQVSRMRATLDGPRKSVTKKA